MTGGRGFWFGFSALLWACGSGEQADTLFSSPSVDAGSDAPIDWPDAESDAASDAAPTFDAPADAPAPSSCSGKTGKSGERILSVPFAGLLRTSILHVPAGYDPQKGTMLVLNFHGFSSAGWQEALLSRMSAAADQRRFIVAYPEGVVSSWNAGACCGTAWTDSVDDVGFVRELINQIEDEYCVDPRRIYATGMSNGGFLSHRLACELSDKVAAIAPVAGVLGVPRSSCKPPRPVPVLQFHGTADPLVPYQGGTPLVPQLGIGVSFLSVADTLEHWRQHNGCGADSQPFFNNGDVSCVAWPGCSAGADTQLCTVDGGGHTWPGGVPVPPLGKTTQNISATEAMLNFFEAHPLP